jgi:preprotein translocase subunit SecA
MRLFGGERVESLMALFKLDKSLPIENRMIGRLVEQAQERVEGNNFDIRKHLLEYDDVLNDQRTRIYEEREHAITKEDLSDDIWGMGESELRRRVPASLEESHSPGNYVLLDEIQPVIVNPALNFALPSYSYHLLAGYLKDNLTATRSNEDKAAFLSNSLPM